MRCIETAAGQTGRSGKYDKLQHEMYWNIGFFGSSSLTATDKLQHEMYWNKSAAKSAKLSYDKLQHEMYWNGLSVVFFTTIDLINYNMRCIETFFCCLQSVIH